MSKEPAVGRRPTTEELARRRSLAAKILELRDQAGITPLTTADLVHQVREEEMHSYGGR